MADVTVREATVDDVEAIHRVAKRGWNAAYDDLLSDDAIDAALAEWYDAETTRELVRRDGIAYFVAADDGVSGTSAAGPVRSRASRPWEPSTSTPASGMTA